MTTRGYEYIEQLEKRIAEAKEELASQEDYAAGLESIIDKFCVAMDKINNLAVSWAEGGPYEDANAESLKAMTEIEELSRLPENRKEVPPNA